jgi:hypothetical protein
MKLVPLSAAASRQERADRLRRNWAAAVTMRTAFPAVQQLRLELKFEGATVNPPVGQSHVLHPPARAFFTYPCPHADCDGQFDLTGAVSAALADPSHQAEGTVECSGMRSKQPCLLRMVYTVSATCQGTS